MKLLCCWHQKELCLQYHIQEWTRGHFICQECLDMIPTARELLGDEEQ